MRGELWLDRLLSPPLSPQDGESNEKVLSRVRARRAGDKLECAAEASLFGLLLLLGGVVSRLNPSLLRKGEAKCVKE